MTLDWKTQHSKDVSSPQSGKWFWWNSDQNSNSLGTLRTTPTMFMERQIIKNDSHTFGRTWWENWSNQLVRQDKARVVRRLWLYRDKQTMEQWRTRAQKKTPTDTDTRYVTCRAVQKTEAFCITVLGLLVIYNGKEITLNSYFIAYVKINTRWIKHLNVKKKNDKTFRRHYKRIYVWPHVSKEFL